MNFALRIPDYYRKEIEELKGNTSINQFVVSAIAEKIASLKTLDSLKELSQKGSILHANRILDKVADCSPPDYDL